MSEHKIPIEIGTAIRLPTAGKYCDRDIIIDTSDIKVARGGIIEEVYPQDAPGSMPYVNMNAAVDEPTYISPDTGGTITLQAPFSLFGNVMPEDVPAGKTFTSVAGLRKVGTKQETSGGSGDTDLPNGYRRVDYIKFSGEQLIDTGIIGNQDTQINVCFTREVSAQRYLFGCAHSENTAAITAYQGGTWRFGDKSATKPVSTVSDKIGHFAFVNKTTIGVTGSVSTISGVNDFETIGTLLLGGCRNSNGSLPTTMFVGKIFFFALWDGDTKVLHLIPVVSTDGAYRFYDTVSKAFFDSVTDTPLEGGNL